MKKKEDRNKTEKILSVVKLCMALLLLLVYLIFTEKFIKIMKYDSPAIYGTRHHIL